MLTARLAEAHQEMGAKQDKLEIAERQIVLVSIASAAATTHTEHHWNIFFPAVTPWVFGNLQVNKRLSLRAVHDSNFRSPITCAECFPSCSGPLSPFNIMKCSKAFQEEFHAMCMHCLAA